ncbi:MAG: NAD(P)-dependent oxidoreductase [Acidimicrobiia bacterium]
MRQWHNRRDEVGMKATNLRQHTLGWIGTGRMGVALCERLLKAGCDLSVYNRTRDKVGPLEALGARVVGSPAELADRDIVFTMVSGPDAFLEVTTGPDGVLAGEGKAPAVIIDSSTISAEASEQVRGDAKRRGTAVLAAPVSGNPKVVASGKLTVVVSGPFEAYQQARPYLELYGAGVTYVGEGEVARLVKICHNLLLGVVTQSLAEVTVLAERSGVARADLLDFLNKSVMGSVFTKYKTPAFVNLDFEPTFTGHLLRKDFELGLEMGRAIDVPLPTAALVHQLIVSLIGSGLGEADFATLLEQEARGAGLELVPEDREVSDGLEPGGE